MNDNTFSVSGGGEWCEIGALTINNEISLSDSSYFYDDPLLVKITPDVYKVKINTEKIDGFEHVKAVRIATGEKEFINGKLLGYLNVDFAQIAICDRFTVEQHFDKLGDDGMSVFYDQLNVEELYAPIFLHSDIVMYVVRPGCGDGNYPVFELLNRANELLGVEINCMC